MTAVPSLVIRRLREPLLANGRLSAEAVDAVIDLLEGPDFTALSPV